MVKIELSRGSAFGPMNFTVPTRPSGTMKKQCLKNWYIDFGWVYCGWGESGERYCKIRRTMTSELIFLL
jgi:hypothetical protein